METEEEEKEEEEEEEKEEEMEEEKEEEEEMKEQEEEEEEEEERRCRDKVEKEVQGLWWKKVVEEIDVGIREYGCRVGQGGRMSVILCCARLEEGKEGECRCLPRVAT
jgi:hypothetical protein